MSIFIVRHGQCEANKAGLLNGQWDTELTDLGRRQALKTAKKIRALNIEVIYSSPLKRAHETARIIAKELGIKTIKVVEDLKERRFGILTGRPIADIKKYCKNTFECDGITYFPKVAGNESFPALKKRTKEVLKQIIAKQTDKNILIVTHGDAAKMLRANYNKWTWKEGIMTPHIDNAGIIKLQ